MSECKLDNPAQIVQRLQTIEANVSKKHIRKALRAGAKVVRAQCIADAPTKSGRTRNAIQIKAGKRSRSSVKMIVSLGAGLFTGATFYAGFVNYGFKWAMHRTKSTGRFIKRESAALAAKLFGKAQGKKVEGTRWLNNAFAKSKESAEQRITTSLTESLEKEAKGSGGGGGD